MQRQILEQPVPIERRPLRRAEGPSPRPGAGELVIEVGACAVCRTDLQLVEGDLERKDRFEMSRAERDLILAHLEGEGFSVVAVKKLHLSEAQARA